MPTVGSKHFPYTPAGEKAASNFAKKSGKKMVKRKYNAATNTHDRVAPNPKAPLGQGGRFAAVEANAAKNGAKCPSCVAAAVGMKKYGKAKMEKMAHAGR